MFYTSIFLYFINIPILVTNYFHESLTIYFLYSSIHIRRKLCLNYRKLGPNTLRHLKIYILALKIFPVAPKFWTASPSEHSNLAAD